MTNEEKRMLMDCAIDMYVAFDQECRKFGTLYDSEVNKAIVDYIKRTGDIVYPNKYVKWMCNGVEVTSTFGDILFDRAYQEAHADEEEPWLEWELVEANASREDFYIEAEKWGEKSIQNNESYLLNIR